MFNYLGKAFYLLSKCESAHHHMIGERVFIVSPKNIDSAQLINTIERLHVTFHSFISSKTYFDMIKRKVNDLANEDQYFTSIVVSSPEIQRQETSWTDCLKRLVAARNHLSHDDPLLSTLAQLSGNAITFDNEVKKAADEAERLSAQLVQKVKMADETCIQESHHFKQLNARWNKFRMEQSMLSQQLQECNATYHELQQQTERLKEEASEDMNGVEQIKETEIMEVTRLRHQISLFALCSGIKWDYAEEGLLAGEVVSGGPLCNFVFMNASLNFYAGYWIEGYYSSFFN